jgi:hypothetical protein
MVNKWLTEEIAPGRQGHSSLLALPEMQGMVRIVSSVSRRRKIGERSDAEGGYISAAERDQASTERPLTF